MRCLIREIDEDLVDEAPAPSFRRIEAFDDGMPGPMEMLGSMLSYGLVAAAYVTAFAADTKMKPFLADLEALLAAKCLGSHRPD